MISYLIIPDSKVIKEYLSYGLLAVTAVLLFLLFGGGNKWFSNLVYVFILLPSVFFIRKYLYAVKKIKAVMVLLFLYSFYSALVLLIDGEGVESFKYFLMLVLFYFFVLINFNSNNKVLALFSVFLTINFLFLTYGLLDAENLGVARYSFGGINANRLTVLFIFPFVWFACYCFSKSNIYRYIGFLVLFIYGAIDFYLLGSRSIIFLLAVFFVFFVYEFRSDLKRKDVVFLLLLCIIFSLVFYFYAPLYEKLIDRGVSYRKDIWLDAINRMVSEECFLFGCGKLDGYKFLGKFDNPHGVFISSFYYYGVIGFALFLSFLTICYIRLSGFYRVGFIACLAYFIFTHVELIVKPSVIWLYFWLPLFLGLIQKGNNEHA